MNVEYFTQVKIRSGPAHNRAWARAVDVATHLLQHVRWSGHRTLVIDHVDAAHTKIAGVDGSLDALVEGVDYWIEM